MEASTKALRSEQSIFITMQLGGWIVDLPVILDPILVQLQLEFQQGLSLAIFFCYPHYHCFPLIPLAYFLFRLAPIASHSSLYYEFLKLLLPCFCRYRWSPIDPDAFIASKEVVIRNKTVLII